MVNDIRTSLRALRGANSYEPSSERPPICPWCRKPKRRGSREDLVALIRKADSVILNALGFITGGSIMNQDQIKATLVEMHKEIQDA